MRFTAKDCRDEQVGEAGGLRGAEGGVVAGGGEGDEGDEVASVGGWLCARGDDFNSKSAGGLETFCEEEGRTGIDRYGELAEFLGVQEAFGSDAGAI